MKTLLTVVFALFFFSNTYSEICQDYSCDSLAVRAILDSNGLDTVLVDFVSNRDSIGRINKLVIIGNGWPSSGLPPKTFIIPKSIGNLIQLDTLVFYFTSLETLPDTIVNLTNLKSLQLNGNELCTLNALLAGWVTLYEPNWLYGQNCNYAHSLNKKLILDNDTVEIKILAPKYYEDKNFYDSICSNYCHLNTYRNVDSVWVVKKFNSNTCSLKIMKYNVDSPETLSCELVDTLNGPKWYVGEDISKDTSFVDWVRHYSTAKKFSAPFNYGFVDAGDVRFLEFVLYNSTDTVKVTFGKKFTQISYVFNNKIKNQGNIFKISPNPFNSSIKITYPKSKGSSLTIYNSSGKLIKTLSTNTWNGQDSHGNQVPSGIYLIQLKANDQVYNRRVSLVR